LACTIFLYRGRIKEKHGIGVFTPGERERQETHDIIYEELVRGIKKERSKKRLEEIIDDLTEKGAQGIILGCTELPMLLKQEDSGTFLFDTTAIHAQAAVDFSLE